MKGVSISELLNPPAYIRITAFVLLSFSLIYLSRRCSSSFPGYQQLASFSLRPPQTSPSSGLSSILNTPLPPPPPPPHAAAIERMGVVDENGVMNVDFEVGVSDLELDEPWEDSNPTKEEKGEAGTRAAGARFTRFEVCGERMKEYIPCLDNAEAVEGLSSRERGEQYERHCPSEGKGLTCLVPALKGYRTPIPWPQSRDEVWFSNVPHPWLVEDKGGQKWISIKNNKFIFPGGGTEFIHGANQYLDQISRMVPDIAFGHQTHVALDIGCGVASFGAFLLQRNVTTLSIAPKDIHENQIQFALERGVPAMVAVFATRRLLYPSQAFDLVHCSRCQINWTRDDGILLLEVNRMLRAGGYFVWAAQPVYKDEEKLQEQWKEMEILTAAICWVLVKKVGYISIWRKPLNNSCYINRDPGSQPPLCDPYDDPDNVWYVGMKACITRLPVNGYGGNITTWPARLHKPPDRLQSIAMDAYISRKEIFLAETKYWNEIIESYVNAFRWKNSKFRNVMDMRAGFGGFAAALHDLEIGSWVMNVVPLSGFNTLPVIYDRGLIGVMHDWCEPFDTYPRTYDLLHAMGLFSVERKRCNISSIMLEMDRMLRPGGRAYIRDSVNVVYEVRDIASAMGWLPVVHDTGEGPHASWKILICEKRDGH